MSGIQNPRRNVPAIALPKMNEQITSNMVRLVVDGKGTEVVPTREAIAKAQEQGLDLVEISPGQDPPIVKILNFGKWRFEQQKKKKDQAKNQHVIQVKEIKMRPKIGGHDYEIKKNQALGFIEKGNKVKFTLRFRGREISHPELGMAIMNRILAETQDLALVETPAKMEGKQIVMILAPKPGTPKKKPENAPDAKKEVAT